MSSCLQPRGLQHTKIPCSSPRSGACSNSRPSSQLCHPTITSFVIPFCSCLQSFPEWVSGSFPMRQFFPPGGQSIGTSVWASVLPMNIQNWFPLGLTFFISSQSKEFSRVFSKTTVQKHHYFLGPQLSLRSNSHIHTCYWKNHGFD